MNMTISEFNELLSKVETAVTKNEDSKTALIYLHKVLGLLEEAAFYAWYSSSDEAQQVAAGIKKEAHEHTGKVLGFIQELVREEDQGK